MRIIIGGAENGELMKVYVIARWRASDYFYCAIEEAALADGRLIARIRRVGLQHLHGDRRGEAAGDDLSMRASCCSIFYRSSLE